MIHPRKPLRLPYYNYSANGGYFLTICTQNQEHYFGEIKDDKMFLSEYGHLAKKYWEKIPEHFDDVILDIFVIMPNHIHGIVFLENNIDASDVGAIINRPTIRNTSINRENQADGIRPYNGLISKIMKSFKWAVSKNGKKFFPHLPFSWQKSFHDRIIRNEKELGNIREYIQNNPLKWNLDEENLLKKQPPLSKSTRQKTEK